METDTMTRRPPEPPQRDPSLPREIGQSLYLLALTALVSAGSLGLVLLTIRTLD